MKKALILILLTLTPTAVFAKTKLYDMVVEQSSGVSKFNYEWDDYVDGVNKEIEVVNNQNYAIHVYAGNPENINNFVRIDDMCFNILRTTYSNGVKLTYYGPYEDGECVHERISGYYNTDEEISFKHVGYMYGLTPISYDYNSEDNVDISCAFLNQNDSDIKKKLDRFYQERLTDYNDWMSDDIYCNDRVYGKSYGLVVFRTACMLSGWCNGLEINERDAKQITCEKNDSFTVNNEDGNKALTYPIGTISLMESMLATSSVTLTSYDFNVINNWLYDLYQEAWTMTPDYGEYGYYGIAYILTNKYEAYNANNNRTIIPVISVNDKVYISTGNGTIDNPYSLYYDDGVIRGQVVWSDEENKDGIRPEQVSIKIYADGTVVDEIIVKASDDWKFEIKVDEYTDLGAKISYVLTQDGVEGYELDVSGSYDEGYTLTNTHMITEPEPIPENKEEEVKAETEKEEKKPENPKTGRNNTMIISLSILVLMIASYFFIRKQDLFKSNL